MVALLKLETTHTPRQTTQKHGCPDCKKITWHYRHRVRGITVLRCKECGRKGATA